MKFVQSHAYEYSLHRKEVWKIFFSPARNMSNNNNKLWNDDIEQLNNEISTIN